MLATASHPRTLRRLDDFKCCSLRALARRMAAASVLLSLLPASGAFGDIYKWTDEQGGIVYSNTLPDNPKQASNVERVARERAAPPAEQALQERIDALERRLQARAAPPPAPPAPAIAPPDANDGGYYYPPPPPPPPAYVSQPVPGYFAIYRYPLIPAYSYYTYQARSFVTRPYYQGVPHNVSRSITVHRGRR